MIIHQAPAQAAGYRQCHPLTQQPQIILPIVIAKKYGLTAVTALDDMVRQAGHDNAAAAGHDWSPADE
jgi:hypothetical protein